MYHGYLFPSRAVNDVKFWSIMELILNLHYGNESAQPVIVNMDAPKNSRTTIQQSNW